MKERITFWFLFKSTDQPIEGPGQLASHTFMKSNVSEATYSALPPYHRRTSWPSMVNANVNFRRASSLTDCDMFHSSFSRFYHDRAMRIRKTRQQESTHIVDVRSPALQLVFARRTDIDPVRLQAARTLWLAQREVAVGLVRRRPPDRLGNTIGVVRELEDLLRQSLDALFCRGFDGMRDDNEGRERRVLVPARGLLERGPLLGFGVVGRFLDELVPDIVDAPLQARVQRRQDVFEETLHGDFGDGAADSRDCGLAAIMKASCSCSASFGLGFEG